MIAYESQGLINYSGTFPNAAAINATSAGAVNGTPLMAAWVNDLWAFEQTLLYWAGMTPSGVAEAAPASATASLGNAQQKLGALQMAFGAPGEIVFDVIAPGTGTYGTQTMAWGASAGGPPARYQYRRVVACTGQTVAIASYPDLAAAIYCGDANNAAATHCYKSTDSGGVTHSTAGTYITLPDFRGVVPRGKDSGSVHDPLGGTRGGFGGEIASLQIDSLQGHYHSPLSPSTGIVQSAASGGSITSTSGGTVWMSPASIGSPVTDGANGTPRTSTETRMYNFMCSIGVRY